MPTPDAAIPDATPVATVAAPVGPGTCRLDRVDGLRNGDRIRLVGADGVRLSGYARLSDGDALALCEDATLARPVQGLPPAQGMEVVRLAGDDWAVVIALNHYWWAGLRTLNGAVRDATLFVQWVRDVACVPDEQIITVAACDAPPAREELAIPTVDTVSSAFIRLWAAAKKLPGNRLGRRLYIFCSGHGVVPLQQATKDYREAALLMASASSDNNFSRHIPTRGYAEWFRANGIFDEVILFVDCCRDLKNNVPLTPLQLPSINPDGPDGRQYYAVPTRLGAKAYEEQVGAPPEWRGLFSYALIEALNDATLHDGHGVLTGSVLRDHLYRAFPALTDRQVGAIDYDPRTSEIALIRRRDFRQPVAIITFAPDWIGRTVTLHGPGSNGRLTPVATTQVAADGVWRVGVVLPAFYKLVCDNPVLNQPFETEQPEMHVSVP